MLLTDETCPFCSDSYWSEKSSLSMNTEEPILQLKNRIIAETENFVVAATIGAFVEGYVLIISKSHYFSIAQMPSLCHKELQLLLGSVQKKIRDTYDRNSVCFEHGESSCSRTAGGCISHAHIHVIPCDKPMIAEINYLGLNYREITSVVELARLCRNCAYLFFQDTSNKKYVFSGQIYPSQLFRQLLSSYYGLGDKWDWRRYPFIDNIEKTIERLRIM